MWLSQNLAFPTPSAGAVQNNVIAGPGTISGFGGTVDYGSLAYDPTRSALYAFGQGSASVEIFDLSQFTLGGDFNKAPARAMGDTALTNLYILSHPWNGDWLLGADYTTAASATGTATGGPSLLIWKTPSGGGSAVTVTLPNSRRSAAWPSANDDCGRVKAP